jgi:hypothetical protein
MTRTAIVGFLLVLALGSQPDAAAVPVVGTSNVGSKDTTVLELKLPCSVVDKLCDYISKNPITGKAGCTAAGAGAAATCDTIGLGPENPLADVCAGVAGGALAMSCLHTISKGGTFNAPACKQMANCPTNSSSEQQFVVQKPGAAAPPAVGSDLVQKPEVGEASSEALSGAHDGQKRTMGLELKLPCSVVDKLCAYISKNPITGKAGCAAAGAGAAATCETIGLGPEDPLADVCAGVAGGALAMSCLHTISKGGTFNAPACRQMANCPTNSSSEYVQMEVPILV